MFKTLVIVRFGIQRSPENRQYVRVEPERGRARLSAMWVRIALLGAIAFALAACTAGGGTNSAEPLGPSPTGSTSPSTSTATTVNLVGYPKESAKCPTQPTGDPDQRPVELTGEVRRYLLCPSEPGVWGQPFAPYAVTPSAPNHGKAFAQLGAALSLPDKPPSHKPCAAIAVAPRTILVQTTDGYWRVHIPVDGCGMELPQVTEALRKVPIPR